MIAHAHEDASGGVNALERHDGLLIGAGELRQRGHDQAVGLTRLDPSDRLAQSRSGRGDVHVKPSQSPAAALDPLPDLPRSASAVGSVGGAPHVAVDFDRGAAARCVGHGFFNEVKSSSRVRSLIIVLLSSGLIRRE